MHKEIVIDVNPYQTRVVLLEDGSPSEIYIERRGKERLVGNIYKGKVQNVLPGMQAAFVDIGLERNAFLYAGDIVLDKSEFQFGSHHEGDQKLDETPNVKDILKPGQDIMVQVIKEPIGTKGARVTTHITLPGRSLVLMPTVNYIGVSRRIDDESERARLKSAVEGVKPPDMGVIVRTAAVGKEVSDFANDMAFLTRMWNRIQEKERLLNAPRLIHAEEPLMFRTLRDLFSPDIHRLVINDREFFEKIQVIVGILSPAYRSGWSSTKGCRICSIPTSWRRPSTRPWPGRCAEKRRLYRHRPNRSLDHHRREHGEICGQRLPAGDHNPDQLRGCKGDRPAATAQGHQRIIIIDLSTWMRSWIRNGCWIPYGPSCARTGPSPTYWGSPSWAWWR